MRTRPVGGGDAPGRCVRRFADLAARVLAAPARLGRVRLVGVDGPAGSGKSTFAGRLAGALRARDVLVGEVHTDDLLDGWTGPAAFWPRLESGVLAPLALGHPGGYHPYDWQAERFATRRIEVPVPEVLIVEGVTSASKAARGRSTLAVYVVAPRALRLARGIARDGEDLRPRWLRWMADEDAHFAADRTVDVADLVVDGAPTAPHDPEREYVLARCGPDGTGT